MNALAPVRLVLDTNVVIDWLVFDDPFMAPLREGVSAGLVEVLTHADLVDELARVLGYKSLSLSPERQVAIHARYLAQTRIPPLPEGFGRRNLMLPGGFPRCRDRDDEVFLALAFHARADWLASRDNAVLGLKKRLEAFRLKVLNVSQTIAALAERLESMSGDQHEAAP
ncbi:MAG TPA: PIN domain-containing protein [Usitatibacteraceae bacterium]|nr:PIN domain-containing protein [Usitatibacteraceae bacterium]